MEAKQDEDRSNECEVCFEILNKDNRALLKPCGLTNVCIECAQEIYQNTKLLIPKALKQKGMEAEQAEDRSNECAVCFEISNKDNRPLLKPCGHTNVCLECAQEIYQTTGLCPVCGQEIKLPTLLPQKLSAPAGDSTSKS